MASSDCFSQDSPTQEASLVKNTFHTLIGFAAEDLGVFQESNPLFDNFLVNVLKYETSATDSNTLFLTVYNSVQRRDFSQKDLTQQIVKLARTRFLKQRLSSQDEELHKDATIWADYSAVNIITAFATVLNGGYIFFCGRTEVVSLLDIARPTFLTLPLCCKAELTALLRKNAKIDIQGNTDIVQRAQFVDVRQYSTSSAVYPFVETCQFQVGEQLRVLLIESLTEAEQQFFIASLNCHVLSYMEA